MLPFLAIIILTLLGSFVLIGVLSSIWASLGIWLSALILLLVFVLSPDVYLSGKKGLNIKAIFGLMAVMFLVMGFLGFNPSNFINGILSSLGSITGSVTATNVSGQQTEALQWSSIAPLLLIIVLSLSIAFLFKVWKKK